VLHELQSIEGNALYSDYDEHNTQNPVSDGREIQASNENDSATVRLIFK